MASPDTGCRRLAQSREPEGCSRFLATVEIQEKIIEILETVITKAKNHERKKRSRTDLFCAKLRRSMTAQLRADAIDLPQLISFAVKDAR